MHSVDDLPYPGAGRQLHDDFSILARTSVGPRRFAKRETLAKRDVTPPFGIISRGWAYRYCFDECGKRQIYEFLLPGDLIGLCSLAALSSSHMIAALTDVELDTFDVAEVVALADSHASLARALMRASVIQTRMLEKNLLLLQNRQAPARVAGYVHALARRMIALGMNDGSCFAMPLTQYDMADATGLTAIHLNRTLRILREMGVMRFSRGEIEILSWERLLALMPANVRDN